MRVSEIRVNQIRVNQGLGVLTLIWNSWSVKIYANLGALNNVSQHNGKTMGYSKTKLPHSFWTKFENFGNSETYS